MGAWRGSSHIQPGAAMTAALRVVRAHAPGRRTATAATEAAAATVASAEPASLPRSRARRRPHLAPWARSGVRHPNPRMDDGLVPRLLHP
jgi:hypothetical protein